ncbi:hypothetical protein SBOR_6801 [Sclerotinia borealis F-4128]|uniref:Uncharacterized protein n=1 Tax=Sclerotinia borealis (strain F-4128) TaxID=1432307 RepID=W9CDE3_SCLBF|nr:hypothetical protein SBOR_6801 [Sclerotinia borealis F-4128]
MQIDSPNPGYPFTSHHEQFTICAVLRTPGNDLLYSITLLSVPLFKKGSVAKFSSMHPYPSNIKDWKYVQYSSKVTGIVVTPMFHPEAEDGLLITKWRVSDRLD